MLVVIIDDALIFSSQYNGHEIIPGKFLKVNISVANVRLFVGNIPKNKSREDILEEFRKHTGAINL